MDREPENMLRRAFVDHGADYIVISSRREQARLESAWYGLERGWLDCKMEGSDEQSMAMVCRLTAAGREYFGLPVEREGGQG